MKLCGKQLLKTKNGNDRGTCTRVFGHRALHGSRTCSNCGIVLTKEVVGPSIVFKGSGLCRKCKAIDRREKMNMSEMNYQRPGKMHTFPCGCTGFLPKRKGMNNIFAVSNEKSFKCRISRILTTSKITAKRRKHEAIGLGLKISHSIIRKLMENPNCWCCGEPLNWHFERGKTPHLHHDHETGEIYGFTHPRCNRRALEDEIDRLRKKLREKG